MTVEAAPSPRARRLTFGLFVAVGGLLLLEVLSFGAWWLIERQPFSWSGARAQRDQLAAAAVEAAPADLPRQVPGIDDLEGIARHLHGHVVHPFLGFVYTPEVNQLPDRRRRHLMVDDSGFFVYRNPGPPPSDDPLRVGVFGGSVAFVFSFQGRESFVERVTREVPARGVEVESWALGGFKQPQQLMTLTWLLARGEAPDVVINLDGFNEIALPRTENLRRGTNPFYPRAWERRVRGVPDPRYQALEAEAAYHQGRRSRLAAAFSRPALSWSVSWNFLWRWLDRRADAAAGEAQQRLAEFRVSQEPYAAHGPAFSVPPERVADELAGLWERSSLQMHRLTTAAGGRYLHFLQPNQYVEGSKRLSPQELRTAFNPRSHYVRPIAEGYPKLRQAGQRLRAQGVAFFDLTELFVDEPATVYSDDCCHLNSAGNEALARAIGEAVAQELGAAASG